MGAMSEAEEYIENNMKADNGNMGLIAWRFLIGCRILECLEDMFGAPDQGVDVQVKHANQDNSLLRLGDYEIQVVHKPIGQASQLNEPNSM